MLSPKLKIIVLKELIKDRERERVHGRALSPSSSTSMVRRRRNQKFSTLEIVSIYFTATLTHTDCSAFLLLHIW
jgi:hypothetical protein